MKYSTLLLAILCMSCMGRKDLVDLVQNISISAQGVAMVYTYQKELGIKDPKILHGLKILWDSDSILQSRIGWGSGIDSIAARVCAQQIDSSRTFQMSLALGDDVQVDSIDAYKRDLMSFHQFGRLYEQSWYDTSHMHAANILLAEYVHKEATNSKNASMILVYNCVIQSLMYTTPQNKPDSD